jgi:hypothetical protein
MARQILTLQLDEITAGDYLQWVRDPEPPALDADLLSVSIEADPLGDTVTATLDWAGPAPPASRAAPAAGLPHAGVARLREAPAPAASASIVGHPWSLQRRRSTCLMAGSPAGMARGIAADYGR